MLGSILQIFATIGCIFHFFNTPFIFNIKNWIACLIALFFFVLLIYTLFFSLPFEKTYILQDNHEVYKDGMYALCRHPGVLWYIAFYIALYFSFPTLQLLIASILFCFLNLVYILIEDHYIFIIKFSDYHQYKHITPFLLPNISSIKKAVSTFNRREIM